MAADRDGPTIRMILVEVEKADLLEARAYLRGAFRDGTLNRSHNTTRISQADIRWLWVLKALFAKLGNRSWIYREGYRDVWTIETTCRLGQPTGVATLPELVGFVRGYFDAEGGVPAKDEDRFYVQLVQKNREDLEGLRTILARLGILCGKVHNPSIRVDPDYWRFFVRVASHKDFVRRIGSWHPRKRALLDRRLGT